MRALRSPGEQSEDDDPPESTELVEEPRFLQCLDDAGEMEREWTPESLPGLSGARDADAPPPPYTLLWFQSRRLVKLPLDARLQFSSRNRLAGEDALDDGDDESPRSR